MIPPAQIDPDAVTPAPTPAPAQPPEPRLLGLTPADVSRRFDEDAATRPPSWLVPSLDARS